MQNNFVPKVTDAAIVLSFWIDLNKPSSALIDGHCGFFRTMQMRICREWQSTIYENVQDLSGYLEKTDVILRIRPLSKNIQAYTRRGNSVYHMVCESINICAIVQMKSILYHIE